MSHIMRFRIAVAAGFFLVAGLYAQAAATPSFKVTGPASATTIKNPGSSQVSITVTPENGFTGGVNITSCALAVAPNGAINLPICGIFGPLPTVSITNSNSVSFPVAVATAGIALPVFRHQHTGLFTGGATLACAIFFFPAVHRRKWASVLALLFVIVLASTGCGSLSKSATTPGTYLFSATCADAATGKIQSSGNFTVIVQ